MSAGTAAPQEHPRSARGASTRRSARRLVAVVAATVVADQASKAFAWRRLEDAVVNPGSDVVAPWMDATFSSALSGALLDLAGVLVLTAASILVVRRCHDRMLWWAAALNIAGWTSNLLDRLGLHWLTAPGSRRGTVDWLHGYNVADLVIWAGLALALGWLGRELLRDVGWDPRRPRRRIATSAALVVVIGLVLVGMTSAERSTRPNAGLEGRTVASSVVRLCRDPARALKPVNALLCAGDEKAAHPVEVASALTCPRGEAPGILHATITNPNQDRSARFDFSAPATLAGPPDSAARGQIDPGGAVRLRLPIPASTVPAALYLRTAVQVWGSKGTRWVPGTSRLWTADLCEQEAPEARTATSRLLCTSTGSAHVALTPQLTAHRDDRQPVVIAWSSPMRVTTDPHAHRPVSPGAVIHLADRFLTVVRVVPEAPTDVLTITGRGARTIQHDGAAPARVVAVPVGRCLPRDPRGTPGA